MRNQVSLRNRQASRLRILKIGASALVLLFAATFAAVAVEAPAKNDTVATALAATPFLGLGGLMFQNRPDEAGGGGGAAVPPEPMGSSHEEKLTSSKGIIADLWGRMISAISERDTFKAENARITEQFNAATSTAGGLTTTLEGVKAELATAQGTITTLTSERDGLNTQLNTVQGNVSRLEKLCGLNGVDPNQAIGPVPPVVGEMSTAEEWQTKLAAAKSNDAQMQVLSEFQAAVKAGTVKKSEPA